MHSVVYGPDLARLLGVSEDRVFEMARTRKLPFAISNSQPRRLFIAERDVTIWRNALKDEEEVT